MIKFHNLVKHYTANGQLIKAVDQINFDIKKQEIFGILGLSGAGKSTLLRTINGLEKPTSGEIVVDGTLVNRLSGKQLETFRQSIGMIFQHFHLLSSRTVKGNIALPLETLGWSKEAIEKRVNELAKWIEIEDKLNAYPSQLSGGQKQRVAIARALASNPKILLCDEATSALDPITTDNILKLLQRVRDEFNVTVILITHELHVVEKICDRVAVMSNGKVTALGKTEQVLNSTHSAEELYKKTADYQL